MCAPGAVFAPSGTGLRPLHEERHRMHLTTLSKTARRLAPTAARWGFAAAALLAAQR